MAQAVAQQHLTPTTEALLRWWFNPQGIVPRGGLCFNGRQRQAILDTVTAHEALDRAALEQQRPVHRLDLTLGQDQLQVLLALLVWQLLNSHRARDAGIDDPRFTRHFILVGHHAPIRERLFCALHGARSDATGARDFHTSDLVQLAAMLIPPRHRSEVFDFVRTHLRPTGQLPVHTEGVGVIVICDGRVDALENLARLRHAMLFDDETRPPYWPRGEDGAQAMAWCRQLRRFATARRGHGVQVVFTERPAGPG